MKLWKTLITKKKKKINTLKINTDNYKNILNETDLDDLLKKLNDKSIISVDCETTSLNPIDAELVGVSFGCDTNEAYYIRVAHKNIKEFSQKN